VLRQTQDVEVKWGYHKAGESKGELGTNRTAKTMSVLIRGRFRLEFHDGNRARDVLLEREGDYVLWDAGVPHNWVAEEDSVMLTVRWPSVPEDQVNDTK
jgi:quercetin dioxygenase-like cupin family protein